MAARAGVMIEPVNVVGPMLLQRDTDVVAFGIEELFAYHGDVVQENIWLNPVNYGMSSVGVAMWREGVTGILLR